MSHYEQGPPNYSHEYPEVDDSLFGPNTDTTLDVYQLTLEVGALVTGFAFLMDVPDIRVDAQAQKDEEKRNLSRPFRLPSIEPIVPRGIEAAAPRNIWEARTTDLPRQGVVPLQARFLDSGAEAPDLSAEYYPEVYEGYEDYDIAA